MYERKKYIKVVERVSITAFEKVRGKSIDRKDRAGV